MVWGCSCAAGAGGGGASLQGAAFEGMQCKWRSEGVDAGRDTGGNTEAQPTRNTSTTFIGGMKSEHPSGV
eukprot:351013-Chlamydomonas_euryale.AAC.2